MTKLVYMYVWYSDNHVLLQESGFIWDPAFIIEVLRYKWKRRSISKSEPGADCNFAVPKSREMPPYHRHFLLPPTDCRPGWSATSTPCYVTDKRHRLSIPCCHGGVNTFCDKPTHVNDEKQRVTERDANSHIETSVILVLQSIVL